MQSLISVPLPRYRSPDPEFKSPLGPMGKLFDEVAAQYLPVNNVFGQDKDPDDSGGSDDSDTSSASSSDSSGTSSSNSSDSEDDADKAVEDQKAEEATQLICKPQAEVVAKIRSYPILKHSNTQF